MDAVFGDDSFVRQAFPGQGRSGSPNKRGFIEFRVGFAYALGNVVSGIGRRKGVIGCLELFVVGGEQYLLELLGVGRGGGVKQQTADGHFGYAELSRESSGLFVAE